MSPVETEVLDARAGVHLVALNQPDTRNSLTLETGLAFHRAFQNLASLDPLPRAVILTGRNGVFSSGGDIKLLHAFTEHSPPQNEEFLKSFYRLFLTVRSMPFPVIACVNGHAVGAALALALACDLRYFVPEAKYSFNFVRIGIHPGMASSFLVRDVAGLPQAQELLFTGRYFDGHEALRRGLCHGLFDAAEIQDRCLDVARDIAAAAPLAMRLLKRTLYSVNSVDEALEREAEAQAETYQTSDFAEALDAMAARRPPVFRDA